MAQGTHTCSKDNPLLWAEPPHLRDSLGILNVLFLWYYFLLQLGWFHSFPYSKAINIMKIMRFHLLSL
jgi:hypothetical protein